MEHGETKINWKDLEKFEVATKFIEFVKFGKMCYKKTKNKMQKTYKVWAIKNKKWQKLNFSTPLIHSSYDYYLNFDFLN